MLYDLLWFDIDVDELQSKLSLKLKKIYILASQKKLSLKENDLDLCKRKKEKKPFCFSHLVIFYSVCILHFALFPQDHVSIRIAVKNCAATFLSVPLRSISKTKLCEHHLNTLSTNISKENNVHIFTYVCV